MTAIDSRRLEILNGKLSMPQQFLELIGQQHKFEMETMFASLWHNYLVNKGTLSIPYWHEKFGNDIKFNKFLMHLSKAGWVISTVIPQRNWGECKLNEEKLLNYVSRDELMKIREFYKFEQYKLESKESTKASLTKLGNKVIATGLVREGFKKAGNTQFGYNIPMLLKYKTAITKNLTKSMDKLDIDYTTFADDVNYAEVSKTILDYYIYTPEQLFTRGTNINDSRGRAISSALGKVFNPISNKDARSLLLCKPMSLTDEDIGNVFLFIAELLKCKTSSWEEKERAGKDAYYNESYLTLDLNDEEDRKDLHHNIWLERLYTELDNYNAHYDGENTTEYMWTTPIELDFTASMLGIEGILLDNKPFLQMTNMIEPETLEDAWEFDNIPRNQFKKAMTPLLYGSSKACQALWAKAKIEYSKGQVLAFNHEINNGKLSVANEFKEFIISNVKPAETMKVKIWNEEFTIQCNRYRNVGDYVVKYNAYDTATNAVQTIFHTHTKQVPDLQQFKRYFVTLLV